MDASKDLRSLGRLAPLSRAAFPERPTTRFAPSVTGVLHLGHVLNAVITWGLARALGGRVVLRLEDHDRGRYRVEHERAILDEIEWLGLEPDAGTPAELRARPSAYRQSDDDAPYVAAVERLAGEGRVFACRCTRRQLSAGRSAAEGVEPVHAGPCAEPSAFDAAASTGWRAAVEPGVERFEDLALGRQEQDPASQCGDLLLRDRQHQWTYHLAVVVDDARHGVDLVVRGRDLLESTGRQLRLQRWLGLPAPTYLHHPLIGDATGRKLSKSEGASGIETLRAGGLAPAEVLGRAAWLGGLQERPVPVRATELDSLLERWLR